MLLIKHHSPPTTWIFTITFLIKCVLWYPSLFVCLLVFLSFIFFLPTGLKLYIITSASYQRKNSRQSICGTTVAVSVTMTGRRRTAGLPRRRCYSSERLICASFCHCLPFVHWTSAESSKPCKGYHPQLRNPMPFSLHSPVWIPSS